MGRESKKKISFSHEVQVRLFSLFWSLIQDTCEQFLHSSFEFLCTICEAAKVKKNLHHGPCKMAPSAPRVCDGHRPLIVTIL